jgi:tetratricopeptide (TPR) repeat protein
MTIHPKYTTAYYEPDRNKPCVCGSGIKFKKCCAASYSCNASEYFKNSLNAGDYEDALLHARNHFTWYALSHKAHTIHLLKDDPKFGEYLLHVDIEALAEILENMHLCYYRLGRGAEFSNVIDNVKSVILDIRWDTKIAYTTGIWWLVDNNDEKSAFAAIQSIDFKTCQDSDVLTLYLHVCPIRLTLIVSVDIIDRIIANTRKESVKLQYRVLKALKFYLVCQYTDSYRIFDDAISEFAKLPEDKKSTYGKMQFAYALETYGKVANRPDMLIRALEAVQRLIVEADDEVYTVVYLANLYRLLGDCEEDLEKHSDAIKAYTISLERNPSELTKVFLARSLCNHEELNDARKVLESIDDSLLEEPGKFDLAISWAIVAATSLVAADLRCAQKRLKNIETHDPAFIQLRDRWIIDLLEAEPKPESGKIKKLLLSLNKYVILNPNFFGIGININRIIDDTESVSKNK